MSNAPGMSCESHQPASSSDVTSGITILCVLLPVKEYTIQMCNTALDFLSISVSSDERLCEGGFRRGVLFFPVCFPWQSVRAFSFS